MILLRWLEDSNSFAFYSIQTWCVRELKFLLMLTGLHYFRSLMSIDSHASFTLIPFVCLRRLLKCRGKGSDLIFLFFSTLLWITIEIFFLLVHIMLLKLLFYKIDMSQTIEIPPYFLEMMNIVPTTKKQKDRKSVV